MSYPIDDSQRTWARVIGVSYFVALFIGIFAEFYVTGRVLVYENAVETARNIIEHERLVRLGTAANLIGMCIDVVLITGLYVVLRSVNRGIALLAISFRILETAFLMIAALTDFNVLRLLSGAGYLSVIESNQLASLARLSISAHADAYRIALLLFGLGSSLFGYLWLESRFIPRAFALWGIGASAITGAAALTLMVFPEFRDWLTVYVYAAPIFLFELTMGLWLMIKGLPSRETT